eukprot:TRINITY_DN78719_c0_g1_i1.p1 TRINITY_DN78719_c0_g1~~TRINITY_DN78719_c0_g1_i1.p1  ORF type:complete len:221 (-),score=37.34 TRINITY_DN78719_c0_g1_i1:39-647(-)
MGVKNTRQKQARQELKKNLKASEQCPHCKKKVANLEEHIQSVHSFSCTRCGQRFRSEQAWKHHMRDFHGLKESEAAREDRNAKLDRWVNESKKAGKKGKKGRDKASAQAASSSSATQSLFRHTCELCGATVDIAVDLKSQGLTFKCAILGRPCAQPSGGMRHPAAAAPAPALSTAAAGAGGAFADSLSMAIDTAIPSDDDDL